MTNKIKKANTVNRTKMGKIIKIDQYGQQNQYGQNQQYPQKGQYNQNQQNHEVPAYMKRTDRPHNLYGRNSPDTTENIVATERVKQYQQNQQYPQNQQYNQNSPYGRPWGNNQNQGYAQQMYTSRCITPPRNFISIFDPKKSKSF